MTADEIALTRAVTDFGNLTVVGPVALAVVAWLGWRQGLAAAVRFAWPVLTTFALTVGLKIMSRAHGGCFAGTPFQLSTAAPSGHVSMSTVVFGGVALLLWRGRGERLGLLAGVLAGATLLSVAVTRVLLRVHTPADVLTGLLLGGACAIWVERAAALPTLQPVRRRAELLALVVAVAILVHLSPYRFYSVTVL